MSPQDAFIIGDDDFAFIRRFLQQRSGLALTLEKRYLVETRLSPLARELKVAGPAGIIAMLRGARPVPAPGAEPVAIAPDILARRVVDAMMTNETLFFRDHAVFDLLGNAILPGLVRARADTKRLRIWCAAASTGQEPYSIAMFLDGMGPALAGWTIDIVATDISEDALERARRGAYSQFEVQRGLPIRQLLAHFTQSGSAWMIAPRIRDMVTFQHLNLIEDFGRLGRFDLILCRNVLIYFDMETKVDVLNRLAPALARDGTLMLGAAETVIGLTDRFVPDRVHRGLYLRADAPARDAQAAKPPGSDTGKLAV